MGSTIHGLGLEAEWKGERGLDSSIHLSLFPDCGSNVTSCLMLPLPQLSITMDGTQSQSSLPPLSCSARYFVVAGRKVTNPRS